MEVLDCKCIKEKELAKLKKSCASLALAVIQIGNFQENELYLRNKKKLAGEIGVSIFEFSFSKGIEKEDIIKTIEKLNQDPKITGIMIQKPILSDYSYQELVDYIDFRKDVDAVSTFSKNHYLNNEGIIPCTTRSILAILDYYSIPLKNRKIALVGKSDLSTLPFYQLLHDQNEITLCNSKTKDLKSVIRNSDIVISAIGKPLFFTRDYFCDGQVLIDVGICYLDGRIVGDIDIFDLSDLDVRVTKVPGGVGMLTPVFLFSNLAYARKLQAKDL